MSKTIEANVAEDTVTTYKATCGKCGTELKEWIDDYTVVDEVTCECCGSINDIGIAY